MRYLNKIIFINSAHVPYAEICLDGNVHFIGTQGVGKSTLLRAILFFYNVDKSKLGIKIQAGQKGYDEFYLPYPNSYIIYEVTRETGKFFVMTFLSHGRTAFRIVDCAYDKRFFIEEDGNARYEWGRISEQIGTRVFKSNIIRGYEEFRDIIYGNKQQVSKELRRFSLMESSKYRQVPLTIQNIFLNQSLESRVIKDIIIDSMDFAGDDIDLNRYREEVKQFRQQYEDIWKWYKTERNGKVAVRVDADAVIDRYSSFEYVRKLITDLCGQMNFALKRDQERLPQLREQETACASELARQNRLLGEESEKYTKERDDLKGQEAVIDRFLKTVKEKRRHYDDIGIEQIAEKIGREGELKILRQSLSRQVETLTSKNKSVTEKYKSLMQAVENQIMEFGLQCQQQINDVERSRNEAEGILHDEIMKKRDDVSTQYNEKLSQIQNSLDDARQLKNDLRLEKLKLNQTNPYKEETDELDRKLGDLNNQRLELSRDSYTKQQQIDQITNDVELQMKDLQALCDRDILVIESKIQKVSDEAQKLTQMLNSQKGALIEWLDEHVDGWQNSIGKVLDEEAVLYNASLNPRLAETNDTFYGVRIDTDNIEKTVKTPEELKRQIEILRHKIDNLNNDIQRRKYQLETEMRDLERKPNAQLKQLRMEKINLDSQLNQIPHRVEKLQKERLDFQEKLNIWREAELEKLNRKLGENEKEISNCLSLREKVKSQHEKDLQSINKAFDKRKKEMYRECEIKINNIKNALKEEQKNATQRKSELQAQMNSELKGLGVDVNQLEEISRQLRQVDGKLSFIENNRREFLRWEDDKKEYFDNETAQAEARKNIRQKINDLQVKFAKRRQTYEERIADLSSQLHALSDEQKRLKGEIDRVLAFRANPSCPPGIDEMKKQTTVKPLGDILESLRNHIAERQHKFEDFKDAVNRFKGNFSPQNTFNFRSEFNTDNDYVTFAADLNEFLSNNKIKLYRDRTSRQYSEIIRRIAKDVSDLSQHKADIEKTILDINRDFRENNFAGVIKEIELRAVESNDRLVQQLLNIKHFDDEHGYDLGQLNLFSTQSDNTRTNELAVKLLMTLIEIMGVEQKREYVTLSDTFKLEFKVKENDNDTSWVEKLSNVGSDGTDILVKAMVNIMLINVFKRKISRKFGDFKLHCMMDEIGKLHPNNVEGILNFANMRNIYLINSSPTTYNAQAYKYTYSLTKDDDNNTVVKTLLTIR